MARKKVFSKVKAVKTAAREKVGAPKPTRALPNTKAKQQRRKSKHKPTLGRMLAED